MFWLVLIVLYVCFICALANTQKENRLSNRIGERAKLPLLRINTEEQELLCPQKERSDENTKTWLFELGF